MISDETDGPNAAASKNIETEDVKDDKKTVDVEDENKGAVPKEKDVINEGNEFERKQNL